MSEEAVAGLLNRTRAVKTKIEEETMRTTLMASALAASAILATIALAAPASAMPVASLHADQSAKVEQTRWVCGWRGRCWWRPNFYAYNYYAGPRPFWGPRFVARPWGPRFVGRPWGWRHPWHRRWW